MFDWDSNMPLLPVKNKKRYLSYVIMKTNVKCKSPVFRNFAL